jgi:hypothetical protein
MYNKFQRIAATLAIAQLQQVQPRYGCAYIQPRFPAVKDKACAVYHLSSRIPHLGMHRVVVYYCLQQVQSPVVWVGAQAVALLWC